MLSAVTSCPPTAGSVREMATSARRPRRGRFPLENDGAGNVLQATIAYKSQRGLRLIDRKNVSTPVWLQFFTSAACFGFPDGRV